MKHNIKELNKNEINLICGNGAKESEDVRFINALKPIAALLVQPAVVVIYILIIRAFYTKEASKKS